MVKITEEDKILLNNIFYAIKRLKKYKQPCSRYFRIRMSKLDKKFDVEIDISLWPRPSRREG